MFFPIDRHSSYNRACALISTGVKVIVESLPRSESSLLSVKLGGLFLRDLTTQGTIFPVLVSPKTVSSAVNNMRRRVRNVKGLILSFI